ncbi:MAG: peptidase C1 [Coriobacteriaceae bacterium]|nr:MAG: peptidase C1 [Coriobacteriaceae bacterium]
MDQDNRTVGTDWAAQKNASFSTERANRVARNAVTSSNVMAAARDTTKMRTYSDTYGISVPKTAKITNQRQSGRCWFFSAMNALRHDTMEFLDVDTIEFSQSFGMFYDKLEKANSTLEYAIRTADLPIDSREVCLVLEDGMGDGGYYSFAMNLVRKWGIVPKSAMPETACSKNSTQMNDQLGRLVRKGALELRRMHEAGAADDALRARKQEILADVHRLLATCLGEPPVTFDFELEVGEKCKADPAKVSEVEPEPKADKGEKGEKDAPDAADKPKAKRILRDFGITPLEFAKRYVPVDPDDYVALVSMPGKDRPWGTAWHLTLTDSVQGGRPNRVLNVAPEVLDAAATASLRAGVPCAMACDVMQEFPRYIDDYKYVLSLDGLDLEGLFGVDLSMGRADMIDARETSLTHAMCFQGVELDGEGRPKAWRVENSWGKDMGKDGYLVMSADWFHLYGGEVDVRREFVPADVLRQWDEAPATDIAPWSNVCHALGKRD